MGRLTIEYCGSYVPKELCSIDRLGGADDCDLCCEHCKATEDGNEDCSGCAIDQCFQKLAEYENLEEQGKLLKLPCAVGDTVYQHMIIDVDKVKRKPIYEIFEATVFKFSFSSYGLCFWTETADDKKYQNEVTVSAFGKTVFSTREEAESALENVN